MSSEPRLVPYADKQTMAQETARKVIEVLAEAQAERGEATIVLTGGSMGTDVIRALSTSPEAPMLDWSRVNVWWSDERFLPGKDSERNGVQAADAFGTRFELNWDRVHPVAASDELGSVEAATEDYRQELAAAASQEGTEGALPIFDLALLSLGPDTHVASLFPDRDEILVNDAVVLPIHNSPKPPPERVTFTLPTINSARRVWLLVAGAEKAEALAELRRSGVTPQEAPGSAVRGTEQTLWLVTEDVLPGLPRDPGNSQNLGELEDN